MAIKKGDPFKDDDGLKKELLDDTPPLYQEEIPTGSSVGNAPAKSQHATGRNCPKCAGQLRFREYFKESNLIVLNCKQCNATWHEPDLRYHQDHEPVGNQFLFTNIPPDMVQRWMQARENEKIRKGEWEPNE